MYRKTLASLNIIYRIPHFFSRLPASRCGEPAPIRWKLDARVTLLHNEYVQHWIHCNTVESVMLQRFYWVMLRWSAHCGYRLSMMFKGWNLKNKEWGCVPWVATTVQCKREGCEQWACDADKAALQGVILILYSEWTLKRLNFILITDQCSISRFSRSMLMWGVGC